MADGLATLVANSTQSIAIVLVLALGALLYRMSLKLSDILEWQAATREVLRITSRAPVDLDRVLLTVIGTSLKLCNADAAGIVRPRDSTGNHVAQVGLPASYFDYLSKVPLEPDRNSLVGRALLEARTILILDAMTDPELAGSHESHSFRSWLGVPLMREDKAIGILVLARTYPRPPLPRNRTRAVTSRLYWSRDLPFNDREVELVSTFAGQAAIAIENARQVDEIQDQRWQLKRANSVKSRFLATASHDLRQPLHALNLFVAQLREARDEAEREQIVRQIEAGVTSMNELFNGLLDMSKLDADVLKPDIKDIPVQHLLNRMHTTFANAARERGIRLRIVPSSAWIRSDLILLERILSNLLSNAVRYTVGGAIVVGCRRRGRHLRIDVCDSGPGIPSDKQQAVFAEFYQLAGPVDGQAVGLGLGLSIVKRLGELLDHPLELVSQPAKGTRFSVTVRSGEAISARTSVAAPATDSIGVGLDKRILVIDDDDLVLAAMRTSLEGWGASVLTANAPDEAISKSASQDLPPDLIISDYRLANGETGITAIRRLREEFQADVPAFLISGDTTPARLREARHQGYLLLHKPVTPMALRTTIHRTLGGYAAQGGIEEAV